MSSLLFAAGHIVTINKTDATCFGFNDGTADAIVSGGTGPFSFSWSNGSTSANLTDLVAGTYTVVVTDDSDASTVTESITIEEPTQVPVPVTIPVLNVCENTGFTLTASTISGASYNWTGPMGYTSTSQNPFLSDASVFLNVNDSVVFTVLVSVGGCVSSPNTTLVVIAQPIFPTFVQIPPFCDGSPVPTLPNSSTNSVPISGTWSPFAISNTTTGTYTFTPNAGECANTAFMTVVVNPMMTPTFNPIPPFCENTAAPMLVTISNEGIFGTWNPPVISNQVTSTYEFTPNAGECAMSTMLNVTVMPCNTDSDGDGISDQDEATVGTNPNNPDTDSDGLFDGEEITGIDNPGTPGVPSGASNALDACSPSTSSPTCDADGDGVSNQDEVINGTNPMNPDTDGDGFSDGNEMNISSDPLNPCDPDTQSAACGTSDVDADGVNGNDEASNGTDPNDSDSDNDGYSDGEEIYGIDDPSTSAVPAGTSDPMNACSPFAGLPLPIIHSNSPVCAGSNLNLSCETIPGVTYNWTGPNGFASSLQNPTIPNATSNETGGYVCSLTQSGCASSAASITVVVVASPSAPLASNNSPVCEGSTFNLFSSSIAGANYMWVGPNGFTSNLQNPSVFASTIGNAGVYSVMVSVNGCTSAAESTTVIVNQVPTVVISSNSQVCEGSTLTLFANTIPGATYNWTGPSGNMFTTQNPVINNVTQANAGIYSCVVTTNDGCVSPVATTNVIVQSPCGATTPTFNPIPSFCEGTTPPTLQATSNEGIFGTWNPATISNTVTATYTFTPSAGQNATSTSITVFINPSFPVTLTTPAPFCQGSPAPVLQNPTPNGTTGTWSPVTVDNQASGTYTFTPDAGQCASSASVTVTVNSGPVINISPFNPIICAGSSIILSANGSGGGSSTYVWTPTNSLSNVVGSTVVASPPTTTTYTVVATDPSGCSSIASTTVTVTQSNFNLTTSSTPITECGQCNATASVAINGGAAPFTAQWFGPNGSQPVGSFAGNLYTADNLCGGGYKVVIMDVNGCSDEDSLFIDEQTPIDATFEVKNEDCGQGNGSIIAKPTGTTGDVTYSWSPGGQTTESIFQLSTGNYKVVISDGSGCSITRTVFVNNIGAPNFTFTTQPAACGSATGSIKVFATGGIAPYQYSLDNGSFVSSNEFTGVFTGEHQVRVKSNNGCVDVKSVFVGNVNNLGGYVSTIPANCQGLNGSATAHINGSPSGLTYLWSNGATTPTISNILSATYTCTVTDGNNCSVVLTAFVSRNSDIYIAPTYAYANCNDGVLTAFVYGGVQPYSYLWSPGGQTTQTITGLSGGNYSVTVTDAAGCSANGTMYVYAYDYGHISGKMFRDDNGNCLKDANENYLNGTITATSTTGQVFVTNVNYNGEYLMNVPNVTGEYTMTFKVSGSSSYTKSCAGNTVVLNGNCDEKTFDFPLSSVPGQNLTIESHCGVARPGFVQYNSIYYYNPGTVTMNGTVTLDIDPLITLLGASPAPTRITGKHLEWDFTDLTPSEIAQIQYSCQIPTIQNGGTLGTPIDNVMSITPIAGDIFVGDNEVACGNVIVGSYDPNMKEVYSPQADVSGAIDSSGAELFYTVHFQNTGTDTAFTVVVRDTISPFVDLSTIRFLGASHNYTWSIQPNRCLEVRFDKILLVDSNRNEAASHGYFDFRIKTIKDLPLYATIDNTADIYFDFNEPVITNTVSSPIVAFAGLDQLEKLVSRIYPNPINSEDLNVEVKGMTAADIRFEISDANGRIVSSESVGDQVKFKVSVVGMNAGMYFYKITNKEGAQQNGKLVVTH